MSTENRDRESKYIYVKDEKGVEYVCKISDLKRVDNLSDDEKEACMPTTGDA